MVKIVMVKIVMFERCLQEYYSKIRDQHDIEYPYRVIDCLLSTYYSTISLKINPEIPLAPVK